MFLQPMGVVLSIVLHISVAISVFAFSTIHDVNLTSERVYEVALADFAPRQTVQAEPVAEPIQEAPPEPVVEPPAPEPVVEPPDPEPPKPPVKKISAKKADKTLDAPPPQASPAPPPPPPAPANTAPVPGNVGGYAAYDVDKVDQRPTITKRIVPTYPVKAKRQQVEGKVLVSLVVRKDGTPDVISIRSANPPGYFEESALAAAGKMRFMPGKLQNRAVDTQVIVPFVFSLR